MNTQSTEKKQHNLRIWFRKSLYFLWCILSFILTLLLGLILFLPFVAFCNGVPVVFEQFRERGVWIILILATIIAGGMIYLAVRRPHLRRLMIGNLIAEFLLVLCTAVCECAPEQTPMKTGMAAEGLKLFFDICWLEYTAVCAGRFYRWLTRRKQSAAVG